MTKSNWFKSNELDTKMKNVKLSMTLLLILSTFFISGCGGKNQIQKTGHGNEYVINRDDESPSGNLPSIKKEVLIEATKFCEAMNKQMIEMYSIDIERAASVWPESTLYFECVEQ